MSGLVLMAVLFFLIISLGLMVGREQFQPGFQAMLNQESGYDAGSKGYFNPVYAVEVAQDLQ
jgi:hypothetical protein